ncbi:helix-turn-helix transcriptional regulator [Pseudomonas anguilliseptica]|uniref:helix-turn-helix transcriptional regulator n=1 Tax=Pseudomonas anguilliseptica TaxID=53406 RepID=UPI0037362A25
MTLPLATTLRIVATDNQWLMERERMRDASPYMLAPEYALLKNLPRHQRKRFETALQLMHSMPGSALAWQEVAKRSAISPYHFHRQFTRVFHETPGSYLSRMQLQWAVSMLLDSPNKKIIDIALACGFSSSQALAKALQRALQQTAKAIKMIGQNGTLDELRNVLEPLAHRVPADQTPLEIQLAENLPCSLEFFDQRAIRLEPLPDSGFEELCVQLGEKLYRRAILTPVKLLDAPWEDCIQWFGSWCPASQDSAKHKLIPAGEYLTCECYIVSDMGYLAALEGMEKQAQKLGVTPDRDGLCIEQVLELDNTLSGGVVLRVEVPVTRGTGQTVFGAVKPADPQSESKLEPGRIPPLL